MVLTLILCIIAFQIEKMYSPRLDWFICTVQDDVQIYQVVLWYSTVQGRTSKNLFKI